MLPSKLDKSYDVAGGGGGGKGTECAVRGQNGSECSSEQRNAASIIRLRVNHANRGRTYKILFRKRFYLTIWQGLHECRKLEIIFSWDWNEDIYRK